MMKRLAIPLVAVFTTFLIWLLIEYAEHRKAQTLVKDYHDYQTKLRIRLREMPLQQVQFEGWGRGKTLEEMFPVTAVAYLKSFKTGTNPGFEAYETMIGTHKDLLPLEEHRKVTQHYLEQFPIEDYSNELRYESRLKLTTHSKKHRYPYSLASADTMEMHAWNESHFHETPDSHRPDPGYDGEATTWWEPRTTQALRELHEKKVDAFVRMPEFGWFRTRFIGFDDLVVVAPLKTYLRDPALLDNISTSPSMTNYIDEMHKASSNQFKKNIGLSVAFQKARGYQSHAVTSVETTIKERDEKFNPSTQTRGQLNKIDPSQIKSVWQLQSIELVSLLKHDKPVAYHAGEYLPNMAYLDDVPTRNLSDFEADAIEQLYQGELVVTEITPNTIRFVGAIRGGKVCLNCHAVKAGELLGAFTYQLDRVDAIH